MICFGQQLEHKNSRIEVPKEHLQVEAGIRIGNLHLHEGLKD